MTVLARLKKDGTLLTKQEVTENLPAITTGLIAYYPFSGQSAGLDVISGRGTEQNVESGLNILDCLSNGGWRNPSNWTGTQVWDSAEDALRCDTSGWWELNTLIPVDTAKSWYIEATVKQKSTSTGTFYLGTISYDSSGSVLPGHPGTYDYFGAVGYGLTTDWVRYLNRSITGAPRTGESADTSSYSTFHTGTKYVRILLITNYSGGVGPTWVKDLKFYSSNSDSSNCTKGDGIAVEEGTTNIIANPSGSSIDPAYALPGKYSPGWNTTLHSDAITVTTWSTGYNGGVPSPTVGYHARWVYGGRNGSSDPCMFFQDENSKYSLAHRWMGIAQQLSTPSTMGWGVGTNITISWYQKTNTIGKGAYVGIYHKRNDTGVYDFESCIQYIPCTSRGLWQRAKYTYTITSNWSLSDTVHMFVYGDNGDLEGLLWVDDVQVEAKTFATSFVSGSRSASNLKVPIPVTSFPFTASVTIYNGITNGSNGEGGEPAIAYPMSWWSTSSGYKGVLHQVSRTNSIFQSEKFQCTIVFRSTDYSIYHNSTLFTTENYYNSSAPAFTNPLSLGTRNNEESVGRFNGRYKNLAIYNRELSLDEIKLLSTKTKVMYSTGDTVVRGFREKPAIPTDAYHFPLDNRTCDATGTVQPVYDINVAYEESSAWVGNTTENLVPILSSFSAFRPYSTYMPFMRDNIDFWKFTSGSLTTTDTVNVVSYGYMYYDITKPAGTEVTVSFRGILSDDCNITSLPLGIEGNITGATWVDSIAPVHTNKSRIMSFSSTWSSAAYGRFIPYPYRTGVSDSSFSGAYYVGQPQVELRPFRTPVAFKAYTFTKTGGSAGWANADIMSNVGYRQCEISFTAPRSDGTGAFMMGLATGSYYETPGYGNSGTYLWYAYDDNVIDAIIYESGTGILTAGDYTRGVTRFTITYDGHYIKYYLDNVLKRTVQLEGQTMYLYGSFHYVNDIASNVTFTSNGRPCDSFRTRNMTVTGPNFYRGPSSLSYNFNSSIGLDWSGDWTVSYWKKPMGTGNDTLTQYNIECFGYDDGIHNCIWIGKNNAANNIAVASTNVLGSETIGSMGSYYFGNWHFVCIRKSGTSLTITLKGKDFDYQITRTVNINTSTFFVNTGQNGVSSDFSFGWYNGQYRSNSFYRNLVVLKRAITDTEMTDLYMQMKETTEVVSVHQLQEGKI